MAVPRALPDRAYKHPEQGGGTGAWLPWTSFIRRMPADHAQSAEARYAAFPYENTSPYMTSSQWEAFGYDRAYEAPAPANGPFPLVIVGTGLGFPGWGYLYFATRLASHGCVVAIQDSYRDTDLAGGQVFRRLNGSPKRCTIVPVTCPPR